MVLIGSSEVDSNGCLTIPDNVMGMFNVDENYVIEWRLDKDNDIIVEI